MASKLIGSCSLIRLLPLVMLLGLAGCVTTQTGGFDADEQRALDYSLQLARNYINNGNWEAAQRHLKNALEIDERSPETHELLAMVLQRTGEFELAEEHFRRAMRLDRNSARIRNNYAVFLIQRGRYAEAERELERVVDNVLYERRGGAFFNLGQARARQQNYSGAAQAFERARLMSRDTAPIDLELAESYFHLERFAEAQRHYDAHREAVEQQTPRALWLGIRLADRFNDRDTLASYGMVLRNLYPRSSEYLEYMNVYGSSPRL